MQALVLNPHAGRLRGNPRLIEELSARAPRDVRVFVTQSLKELHQVGEVMAQQGLSRAVYVGGDGSFCQGLSSLARVGALTPEVELAFLPAGTVGTVARGLGQPRNLARGLRAVFSPKARFQLAPSLQVLETNLAGQLTRWVGFIVGTGLVGRFFERYNREGAGGLRAAAQIVARTFAGSFREDEYACSVLAPIPCRAALDSEVLREEAFSLVLCSVIKDVGLGLKVCHRAGEDWQRPHVVASALTPKALGPQLFRVLRGLPLEGQGCYDRLCEQLLLEFSGGNGPWVIDGELCVSSQLQVQAGPPLRIWSGAG